MRRYPVFDPPEYVRWTRDEALARAYRERAVADPDRARALGRLTRAGLLGIYRDLLRTRLHDLALKRWVRSGVLSKAWLGTGEEGVTVGAVRALDRGRDVVSPMIRNAGALHMMGMPIEDMFRAYLATPDSPSRGRDFHIGDIPAGIVQPVSHMGVNVPVLAGVALAFRLRGEDRIALTWVGDGATRTAPFHEGLSFAALERLPVVFVIQNNQVALGTPADRHGRAPPERWSEAYGVACWKADGNHVLDVYAATRLAAEACRHGQGPALVVAETFRMGGHATHDEREAREMFPKETFEFWGRRDPIALYETYLADEGEVSPDELAAIEVEVVTEIDDAAAKALLSRDLTRPAGSAGYEGFSTGTTLESIARRPV